MQEVRGGLKDKVKHVSDLSCSEADHFLRNLSVLPFQTFHHCIQEGFVVERHVMQTYVILESREGRLRLANAITATQLSNFLQARAYLVPKDLARPKVV